jgi:hypothetical protein
MLSRSIIDNSKGINNTSRVVGMMIISDAPSCGAILMTRGVIYDRDIFIIEATVLSVIFCGPNFQSTAMKNL